MNRRTQSNWYGVDEVYQKCLEAANRAAAHSDVIQIVHNHYSALTECNDKCIRLIRRGSAG